MKKDDFEYLSDDYDYLYHFELLDNPENRKILAEKILSIDGLSQIEKEFIHKLLIPIKKKRGRKNRYDRNIELALEEELLKKQGKRSSEIKDILLQKFKLETVAEEGGDRAYYAILKIGKALLAFDREWAEEISIRKKHKDDNLV